MCGICGVFVTDPQARVDETLLGHMNARIIHRGPDDAGQFAEGNVGLAMRRLSIIDVASGHQPMSTADGRYWIVYNGEIYNHRDLRVELEARGHDYRTRSDTETILHLFEEYGDSCVEHLRGMFAFVIWDRVRRRLFAARDRLGIKPFYYRWDGGMLLFASEIKAILAYPGVAADLDRASVREYLAFGYLAAERTMFQGIEKLMPGHTLAVEERSQSLVIRRYWDLESVAPVRAAGYSDYVRTYREMLEQSVSSHLMSDVPLGVFLSGGLDSSAVAALTTKIRGEAIETFSVGYAEEPYSELPYARTVAAHIGSKHHEVRVTRESFFESLPHLIWHEDEPLVWPSSVALYFVARLARERVKVVLTGEGSDETLAGYQRYAWTLLNERIGRFYRKLAPPALRTALHREISEGRLPALMARKIGHTFLGRDGASWESLYFDNFYCAFSEADQSRLLTDEMLEGDQPYAASLRFWNASHGDMLHRMLYTDIKTYLQELLMKQDQMSMAASIESRVPFLDHSLVEYTAGIPGKFLIKGLSGKHVLKSAVADLLPHSIVHRKKLGFPTPWERWLNGGFFEQIERLLLEPRSLERGIFRRAALERLFGEHREKRRDHATRIWRLLNLELWHRVFIDGEASDDHLSHNVSAEPYRFATR